MKLRIKGNSLRLRLLRSEVMQFGKTGKVTETIRFGASKDAQLIYTLEARTSAKEIRADFAGNQITVIVPKETAQNWVETDTVSLTTEQNLENFSSENVLNILIEKDFVCLDRKNDPDNEDAFPHPTGKCA